MNKAFDEVFDDVTRFGTKVKTDEYRDSGTHIIIDQGQGQIAGYTDLEKGLFTDVPAIVFGDHTRIIKYVEKPFFLGADGVKVFRSKDDNANYKYLYYALKHVDIPNTGYNRHFKWLKESHIPYPSYTKQKQIVEVLDLVVDIMEKRRKELSALDNLAKSQFVEMFGDVVSNNKHWPMKQFDTITSSRLGKMLDGKRQTGLHRYPYLANCNVQWFHFELNDLKEMDFDEEDQTEFELEDGDLMVCEGGEIGRCAVWHNAIQPCYYQKAIHRVRCDLRLVLPDYLAWWFKLNCEQNSFESIAGAKATIAHLPGEKLKKLMVMLPPVELQHQFVTLISQLDKSKLAIRKSLDELQLLYDSLMQEYFG